MGLFDKISTDSTGTTAMFTQQAVAFAKLDLNTAFKMAGQGVASLIINAVDFFTDLFGKSVCNDQDSVLVERFWDQIPGMALLLVELGYIDSSFYDPLKNDPNAIYEWMDLGRPKGASPCNELIYPARLLFTILFGVPIRNSNYLDALDDSADAYYSAGGAWAEAMPQNAVDRAVYLKRNYFQISTYNKQQWDLNKFQEYPLVAPVPDPEEVGKLYTGDFLGIHIVNGVVIGDPLPDIDEYIEYFDPITGRWKRGTGGGIIPIADLPSIPFVPPGNGSQTGAGNVLDKIVSFVQNTDPLILIGIAVAAGVVYNELEKEL